MSEEYWEDEEDQSGEERKEEEVPVSPIFRDPTVNLNDYFKEYDQRIQKKPTRSNKKKKPEEVVDDAEEEFKKGLESSSLARYNYAKEQRQKYEEEQKNIEKELCDYLIKKGVQGTDYLLGYDGNAVEILENEETQRMYMNHFVNNPQTRTLVNMFKRWAWTIPIFGIAVEYITYRPDAISRGENVLKSLGVIQEPAPRVAVKRKESTIQEPPAKKQASMTDILDSMGNGK